jgi:hypothetical protein
VSTPVFSAAAPFEQKGARVASNGSVALAVWNDQRNGRTDVTASRITLDGTPLDPTGIVIRAGTYVQDVFWNGQSFAVLTGPGRLVASDNDFVISYVSPEGKVTEGDALSRGSMRYVARTGEGADARFLFMPEDALPAFARIVDGHGNVIREGAHHYAETASFFAASDGSGFLEVRGVSPNPYVAYSLDRDGNVLQSIALQLPPSFEVAALTADGRGGYALFGAVRASGDLLVVRLDDSGAATGHPQWLQSGGPSDWNPDYQPLTATATSDGFVASWLSDGRAYVTRGGAAPVRMLDCDCRGVDAAYDPADDLLIASYDDAVTSSGMDVFVQKGNGTPIVLTHAAARQTSAAIAAGANGFLVAWTEGDTTDAHVYVRRYAPNATPLEEAKVAATDGSDVSIISSGDVYLVYSASYARRMDARSGQWIDPAPFSIDAAAAASNGDGALALTVVSNPFFEPSFSTSVRRISMTGTAAVSEPVKLSDFASESRPAIASNGTDYLAVWNECLSGCSLPSLSPNRLVAMRLHADGTRIDPAPFVIEPSSSSSLKVAAGWNGKTYLVTWTQYGVVRAAYVSSGGSVQQLGNIRALNSVKSMKIVSHGGEFLLLTALGSSDAPDELRVTLLDGSSSIIATRPSGAFGPLDGASDGGHLMLAYDRVEQAAGRVGRVFIDPRVFPSRKRAVR